VYNSSQSDPVDYFNDCKLQNSSGPSIAGLIAGRGILLIIDMSSGTINQAFNLYGSPNLKTTYTTLQFDSSSNVIFGYLDTILKQPVIVKYNTGSGTVYAKNLGAADSSSPPIVKITDINALNSQSLSVFTGTLYSTTYLSFILGLDASGNF